MTDYHLGEVEMRFAELIWANEPLGSGELVKLCAEATTYTVLKKLCEKGFFKNEGGTVSSLISEKEMRSRDSHEFVENSFGGSLPAFLAAFASGRKLSEEEVADIRRLIDGYGKEAAE